MLIPYEKCKIIRFIVDGQLIKIDPTCDIVDLVPGTEKYVRADFLFSSEWRSYVKVVGFYSSMGREYEPQELKDGRSCWIPSEALKKREFKVSVIGKNADSKLVTNKVAVRQNGGRT